MGRTSDADQRLKSAALELMWEESYGAVSVDDICKRADVKKGSFYHFFASKSDLAVATLEALWQNDWKPRLDATFSSSTPPLQRFVNYFRLVVDDQQKVVDQWGKVLGCPVCSVGSEVCNQDEKLSAKVREIIAKKRRYYETAIRDAIAEGQIEDCDPAAKATCLIGFLEGAVAQSRILNSLEPLKQLQVGAIDMLHVKAGVTV